MPLSTSLRHVLLSRLAYVVTRTKTGVGDCEHPKDVIAKASKGLSKIKRVTDACHGLGSEHVPD